MPLHFKILWPTLWQGVHVWNSQERGGAAAAHGGVHICFLEPIFKDLILMWSWSGYLWHRQQSNRYARRGDYHVNTCTDFQRKQHVWRWCVGRWQTVETGCCVGEFNEGHVGEGRDSSLRDTWGSVRDDRQRHNRQKKMRWLVIVNKFGRLAAETGREGHGSRTSLW